MPASSSWSSGMLVALSFPRACSCPEKREWLALRLVLRHVLVQLLRLDVDLQVPVWCPTRPDPACLLPAPSSVCWRQIVDRTCLLCLLVCFIRRLLLLLWLLLLFWPLAWRLTRTICRGPLTCTSCLPRAHYQTLSRILIWQSESTNEATSAYSHHADSSARTMRGSGF
jgi:hypothetical protein